MVVILAIGTFVAVQPIEVRGRLSVRVVVAVDWIAIQSNCHGATRTNDLLQMNRSDVIVVVVGSTTVPTPLVKFTGLQRIRFAIVLDRIEDRYAVDRDSNRPTKEMLLR